MPSRKGRLYVVLAMPTGHSGGVATQADQLLWSFVIGSKDDAKGFSSYSLKVSRPGPSILRSDTSTQDSDDTLFQQAFNRVLVPQKLPNAGLGTRRILIRLLIAKVLNENSLDLLIQKPSVPQYGDAHESAPSLEWAETVLSHLRQDVERGGTDGRPVALGATWFNVDWEIIRNTAVWFAKIKIPRLPPMSYATFDLVELSAHPERS